MTRHHKQNTQTEDPINLLLEHGLAEGLPQIAEMLMNTAMLIERSAHLGADLYERSEGRNGYWTFYRTQIVLRARPEMIMEIRKSSSV